MLLKSIIHNTVNTIKAPLANDVTGKTMAVLEYVIESVCNSYSKNTVGLSFVSPHYDTK